MGWVGPMAMLPKPPLMYLMNCDPRDKNLPLEPGIINYKAGWTLKGWKLDLSLVRDTFYNKIMNISLSDSLSTLTRKTWKILNKFINFELVLFNLVFTEIINYIADEREENFVWVLSWKTFRSVINSSKASKITIYEWREDVGIKKSFKVLFCCSKNFEELKWRSLGFSCDLKNNEEEVCKYFNDQNAQNEK